MKRHAVDRDGGQDLNWTKGVWSGQQLILATERIVRIINGARAMEF